MSVAAMIHVLQHKSEELARDLSAKRYYTNAVGGAASESKDAPALSRAPSVLTPAAAAYEYDPRFLIFEYMQNIMLHKRQVQLVNDFMTSARAKKSCVHQMM